MIGKSGILHRKPTNKNKRKMQIYKTKSFVRDY